MSEIRSKNKERVQKSEESQGSNWQRQKDIQTLQGNSWIHVGQS